MIPQFQLSKSLCDAIVYIILVSFEGSSAAFTDNVTYFDTYCRQDRDYKSFAEHLLIVLYRFVETNGSFVILLHNFPR